MCRCQSVPYFVADVSDHGSLGVQLPAALVHQALRHGRLQLDLGLAGVPQDLVVQKHLQGEGCGVKHRAVGRTEHKTTSKGRLRAR